MVGSIAMWSGTVANIPTGWVLCNGSSGTPDLRERFVVGVGTGYALASVGGSNTVVLTSSEIPSHSHTVSSSTTTDGNHTHVVSRSSFGKTALAQAGRTAHTGNTILTTSTDGNHGHSVSGNSGSVGTSTAHENCPPYYALAFIMAVV